MRTTFLKFVLSSNCGGFTSLPLKLASCDVSEKLFL
jgi:hypothetical protein